jgi:hypothetical protein
MAVGLARNGKPACMGDGDTARISAFAYNLLGFSCLEVLRQKLATFWRKIAFGRKKEGRRESEEP